MAELVTVTITPSPAEGTEVVINGEVRENNQFTTGAGSNIAYSIRGTGYMTYTSAFDISEDTSITLLTRPTGTAIAWTDSESNTVYTTVLNTLETGGDTVYSDGTLTTEAGTTSASTRTSTGLPDTITVADVVYTRDAESDVQPSPGE